MTPSAIFLILMVLSWEPCLGLLEQVISPHSLPEKSPHLDTFHAMINVIIVKDLS